MNGEAEENSYFVSEEGKKYRVPNAEIGAFQSEMAAAGIKVRPYEGYKTIGETGEKQAKIEEKKSLLGKIGDYFYEHSGLIKNAVYGFGGVDENAEEKLAMGTAKDSIEMLKLARALDIDEKEIERIMNLADSGERSQFGLKINPKTEVMREEFQKLVKPRFVERVRKDQLEEEEAQRKAEEDANKSTGQRIAEGIGNGLADIPAMVVEYSNPLTIGAGVAAKAQAAIRRYGRNQYRLDENGEPVLVKEGERSEKSAIKSLAQPMTEMMIFGTKGIEEGLKTLTKTIPGLEKAAAGLLKQKIGAAEKLSGILNGSQAGRLLEKGWNMLGKGLPTMVAKMELNSFVDEVLGLGTAEGEDKKLVDWISEQTSAEGLINMLPGLLTMHGTMRLLGARSEKKREIKQREFVEKLIDPEVAKKMSAKDLDMLTKLVFHKNVTPEKIEIFLNRLEERRKDAEERFAKGETLEEVVRAAEEKRETSPTYEEALKSLKEELEKGEAKGEGKTAGERAASVMDRFWYGATKLRELDPNEIEVGEEGERISGNGAATPEEEARPIIVYERADGKREVVAGRKRLKAAKDAGEKVSAIIVREKEGWTREEAEDLNTLDNAREGNLGTKEMVKALKRLGAKSEMDLELMGIDAESAEKIVKGLKEAGEMAAKELEGEKGDKILASDMLEILTREKLGEKRDKVQEIMLDRVIGTVDAKTAKEIAKVLAERAGEIDLNSEKAIDEAIAEGRKRAAEGGIEADSVMIEGADGKMKPLGEIKAERTQGERGEGGKPKGEETPVFDGVTGSAENKGTELKTGTDGVMRCEKFPRLRVQVQEKGIIVEGFNIEEMTAPENIKDTAAIIKELERIAKETGKPVLMNEDALGVVKEIKATLKEEGDKAYSNEMRERRTKTIAQLMKSTGIECKTDAASWWWVMQQSGVKPFRNDYGIYGCYHKGKVYLNPTTFRVGGAIHEYGHVTIEILKNVKPELIRKGFELAEKDESAKELLEWIKNDEVYGKMDRETQLEEVLAHIIERKGEKLVIEKGVGEELKAWIKELWKDLKDYIGIEGLKEEDIENMTLDEITDRITEEMFSGKDLTGRRDGSETMFGKRWSAPKALENPVEAYRATEAKNYGVEVKRVINGKEMTGSIGRYGEFIPDARHTQPWEFTMNSKSDAVVISKRFYRKERWPHAFEAAKHGDARAAAALVKRMMGGPWIDDFVRRYGKDAILVPVVSHLSKNRNMIPIAMCAEIGRQTGMKATQGIVQTSTAKNRNGGIEAHLFNPRDFAGLVAKGREYIIVDDHLTDGFTAMALKNFLEANGAKVKGYVCLTADERNDKVEKKSFWMTKGQAEQLREEYPGIDDWLRERNICDGVEALPGMFVERILDKDNWMGQRKAFERIFKESDDKHRRLPGRYDSTGSWLRGGVRQFAERTDDRLSDDEIKQAAGTKGMRLRKAEPEERYLLNEEQLRILEDDRVPGETFREVDWSNIPLEGEARATSARAEESYDPKNLKQGEFKFGRKQKTSYEDLKAAINSGMSRQEIARKFHISQLGLRSRLTRMRKAGYEIEDGMRGSPGHWEHKTWKKDAYKTEEGKVSPLMQAIIDSVEEGMNNTEIAEDLGLSRGTVIRYLRKAQEELDVEIGTRLNEREKRILDLFEEGKTAGEIAIETGIERQAVSATLGNLRKRGIELELYRRRRMFGKALETETIDESVFKANDGTKIVALGNAETTPAGEEAGKEKARALRPYTRPDAPAAKAKPIAMDAADLVGFIRQITGSKRNPEMSEKLQQVFGMLDETDISVLKTESMLAGWWQHESPEWMASHSKDEVAAMIRKSEEDLRKRKEILFEQRVKSGKGGERRAIQVLGQELGQILLMQRGDGAHSKGVSAALTVLDAFVKAKAKAKTDISVELERACAWWHGQKTCPEELKEARAQAAELLGMVLTAPESLQKESPKAYEFAQKILASNREIAEAYREFCKMKWDGKADDKLLEELEKTWDAENARKIAALEEATGKRAGGVTRKLKEDFIYAFHDQWGPMFMIAKRSLGELKARLDSLVGRGMVSRAAANEQLKAAEGKILELKSGLNDFQRQSDGQERLMVTEFADVINNAKKNGVNWNAVRRYAHLMRVIEIGGRATAFGITPERAAKLLERMKAATGEEAYREIVATWKQFRSVYEKFILNDERVMSMFDKKTQYVLRKNAHYVTMRHTITAEEAAQYEAELKGYKDEIKKDPTVKDPSLDIYIRLNHGLGEAEAEAGVELKRLKGSFDATKDPIAETIKRAIEIKRAATRNELVRDLRDVLKVTETKDFIDDYKGNFKRGERLGMLKYMEDGKVKRMVVPEMIERSFRARNEFASEGLQAFGKVARTLKNTMTLWNPMFINRAYLMDKAALEANIEGLHKDALGVVANALMVKLPFGVNVGVPVYMLDNYLSRLTNFRKTWIGKILYNEHTVNYYAKDARDIAKIVYEGKIGETLAKAKELRKNGEVDEATELEEKVRVARVMMEHNVFQSKYRFDEIQRAGSPEEILKAFGLNGDTIADLNKLEKAAETGKKVFHWWNGLEEEQEATTKIIAWLYDEKMNPEKQNLERARYVIENGGTPNLGERGVFASHVENAFGFFWNVRKNAFLRGLKAAKDHPAEYLSKMAVQTVLPTVLKELAICGGLKYLVSKYLFDDDEEKLNKSALAPIVKYWTWFGEAMRNIPGYQQRNYNMIPLWTPEGGGTFAFKIKYSPEEFAVVNMVHAAMQNILPEPTDSGAGSDTAFKGIMNEFLPDYKMNNPATFLLTILTAPLTGINPFDDYRGRYLFSADEMRARWTEPKYVWAKTAENFVNYCPFMTAYWGPVGESNSEVAKGAPASLSVLLKTPIVSRLTTSMMGFYADPDKGGALAGIKEESEGRMSAIRLRSGDVLERCIRFDGTLTSIDKQIEEVAGKDLDPWERNQMYKFVMLGFKKWWTEKKSSKKEKLFNTAKKIQDPISRMEAYRLIERACNERD